MIKITSITIQHELQMMRIQMAMRAFRRLDVPAFRLMNPWIRHVMETRRKSGLKSLHEAIKKAKMSWKKGHRKC